MRALRSFARWNLDAHPRTPGSNEQENACASVGGSVVPVGVLKG